jgi:hypothetical protein
MVESTGVLHHGGAESMTPGGPADNGQPATTGTVTQTIGGAEEENMNSVGVDRKGRGAGKRLPPTGKAHAVVVLLKKREKRSFYANSSQDKHTLKVK